MITLVITSFIVTALYLAWRADKRAVKEQMRRYREANAMQEVRD